MQVRYLPISPYISLYLPVPALEGEDVQRGVLGHARAEAAGEARGGVVAPCGGGEQLVAPGERRLQPEQLRAGVDHRAAHSGLAQEDLCEGGGNPR